MYKVSYVIVNQRNLVLSFYKQFSSGQLYYILSDSGTEMITPFPVPIHSLLTEMSKAVIRTKENPSFPVPTKPNFITFYVKYIHVFNMLG